MILWFSFPCLLQVAQVNSVPWLNAASGQRGVTSTAHPGKAAASELLEKALQFSQG